MKGFWSTIWFIFMVTREWLRWFLGGYDELLYALLIFVAADYITGVMCAIADKRISSEVGVRGVTKKVLIFLLVGIANILDIPEKLKEILEQLYEK